MASQFVERIWCIHTSLLALVPPLFVSDVYVIVTRYGLGESALFSPFVPCRCHDHGQFELRDICLHCNDGTWAPPFCCLRVLVSQLFST